MFTGKTTLFMELTRFPETAEIRSLMQKADSVRDRTFQLSWPTDSTQTQWFVLSCLISSRAKLRQTMSKASYQEFADPDWTLSGFTSTSTTSAVIWTMSTQDVETVLNAVELAQPPGSGQPDNSGNSAVVEENHDSYRQAQPDFHSQEPSPRQTGERPQLQKPEAAAASIAPSPPAEQAKPADQLNLSGDLKNVSLSNVLQTIGLMKESGKLTIQSAAISVEIYFTEGAPYHASREESFFSGSDKGRLLGAGIILDLLLWKDGNFKFFPGWTTGERSISQRLEPILLEGATLVDYQAGLENAGITGDSILRHAGQRSPVEIDHALRAGIPANLELQMELYRRLATPTSLESLVENLARPTWVPVVYSLLNCKLIAADAAENDSTHKASGLFDENLAEIGFKGLCRPDNGLMNYSVFLHYLKQEHSRYSKHGIPFSVALGIVGSDYNEQEPSQINQAFRAIAKDYDTVAHFQGIESRVFAFLLPFRNTAAAFLFMKKFQSQLRQGVHAMRLHVGSASFPQAASDLDRLLRAALEAMERAVENGMSQCSQDGVEEQNWTNVYSLGKEALKENDIPEALHYFRSCEETANANSKQLLQSYDAMAAACLKQREFATALVNFEKALSLRESHNEVRGLGNCLIQIGTCAYALGDHDKAESSLLKAIRCLGGQKQLVCNIYHNLGSMLLAKGRMDDAKSAFKQSISIMSAELGPSHPAVLQVSQGYSRVLSLPPGEQAKEEAARWRNLTAIDFPLDE